jgi:DNA ligase D-like protein (predicted ligase)
MPVPKFVAPMTARLVQELPEGPEWIYEVKFDGYRALLLKDGADVRLRSRNDKDLTTAYRPVQAAARGLHAARAILDGEIVAVDAHGRPSFQALQHRGAHPGFAIVYYAFDLIQLDGRDLMPLPLAERKAMLAPIVASSGILLSQALPGSAAQVADAVRGLGLEGVIAKRLASRYEPGMRSDAWRKLKLERQQEFVVGGYRPGPHGIDALLVGFYEGTSLHFAGKVRAGFTPHVRREVFDAVKALHRRRCPFDDLPNSKTSHWGGGVTAEQMQEMQWLRPSLVAQIRFVEWTEDRHLRHAAFLGLRRDTRASAVRRDDPQCSS